MSGVAITEFKKIDLRVAKVLGVEEIIGADKLWKISIDTGSEKKEIVAGIKAHYAKEKLIGKSIVVVNNLEPAVIRGVESQGMLLAAKDGARLTLLTLDEELPPGSLVG